MKHCMRKSSNHSVYRRFLLAAAVLCLILEPCSCSPAAAGQTPYSEPLTVTGYFFNTVVKISIYDNGSNKLLDGCLSICEQLENRLSRTIEGSDISRINNREEGFRPSSETLELLRTAYSYCEKSDGAFDFTIEPLSKLWNFSAASPKVPEALDIQKAAALVDYQKFIITDSSAGFAPDMHNEQSDSLQSDTALDDVHPGIDLGGIAKGYVADSISAYLHENGVASAIIDLGGNILCIGSRQDGTPFQVGIQMPAEESSGEIIGYVKITDRSVVTSGIYERCFTENGKSYHHILDPTTGYPIDNGLISVTIISDTSVEGDGLSTSCFVLGLEKGMELINKTPGTEAIFITDDNKLHYSDEFKTPFYLR